MHNYSSNFSTVYINKKINHEYAVERKIEAGVILFGSEVKALRARTVSAAGAFVTNINNELWLVNMNIAIYKPANKLNHNPTRNRKLLLSRKEINTIIGYMNKGGFTVIPVQIYFNKYSFAKIEIGICRGLKQYDKRERQKTKDWQRQKARREYD